MEARGITQRQTRDREETESARQAEPAWQAALRRTTDFVVAGTVILLTAPILIIVAIAIRIDSPGPAT